jgi:spermidine synthase
MKQMAAGGVEFISDESRIIVAEINSRVREICKENFRM